MYSLKIGTGTIVVLTDRRLIKELLDKKSSIYSKRPASYLSDFITGGDHVLLMDYRYVFMLLSIRNGCQGFQMEHLRRGQNTLIILLFQSQYRNIQKLQTSGCCLILSETVRINVF